MSKPGFPICVKCQVEYRPKTNGINVELMADFGSFELYKADKVECPGCGHQIITGYGDEPFAIHFKENYKEVLEKVEKSGRTYKCYEKVQQHHNGEIEDE